MQNAYTILLLYSGWTDHRFGSRFLAGSQKKKLNYIICSIQKKQTNQLLMQSSVIPNIKTEKISQRLYKEVSEWCN